MAELLYCIEHGTMDMVTTASNGMLYHITVDSMGDMEVCEGPFATCPPPDSPDDVYFDYLFSNDGNVADRIDYDWTIAWIGGF